MTALSDAILTVLMIFRCERVAVRTFGERKPEPDEDDEPEWDPLAQALDMRDPW